MRAFAGSDADRAARENAPFSGQGQCRQTVTRLAAQWEQGGQLTAAERQDVVAAAARAHLAP